MALRCLWEYGWGETVRDPIEVSMKSNPRQEKGPLNVNFIASEKEVFLELNNIINTFFSFFYSSLFYSFSLMISLRRSQTLIITAAVTLILLTYLSWNDRDYMTYVSPAAKQKQEEAARAIDQRYCGGPCRFLLPVFIVEQGKAFSETLYFWSGSGLNDLPNRGFRVKGTNAFSTTGIYRWSC